MTQCKLCSLVCTRAAAPAALVAVREVADGADVVFTDTAHTLVFCGLLIAASASCAVFCGGMRFSRDPYLHSIR